MENNIKGPLIKDVFNKELSEVCKYLYVRMQGYNTRAKAIVAWDNLEILMYSSIYDKERLVKVIKILETISDNNLLDFKVDKKKLAKYRNI